MIYAMSDIHGCIDELKEKMKKLTLPKIIVLFFWEIIWITGIIHIRF